MVGEPDVLSFQNVTKKYHVNGAPDVLALENITFTVPNQQAGEFVALIGPSGSGKSTILNMIAGLLAPSTGSVHVLGEEVCGPTETAITVQQAYTCFPWLTVRGNVEFGLDIIGVRGSEAEGRAMRTLEQVGLADRANAMPKELSGGMQQRVALARALALKRQILLMDEPFGALDAQTRSEMQQLLMEIWGQEKNTIFFITHDIGEAVLLADRILVLSPRPSKIVLDLPISFSRPRSVTTTAEPGFVEIVQSLLKVLQSHG